MFAVFQRGHRDFLVRCRGSNDTNEVNIIDCDQLTPVIRDMSYPEFFGDTFSVLAMTAGYRDHASANAILECWDLSCARKAGAYDSNADDFLAQSCLRGKIVLMR
jgi:hypothetical protein